MKKAIVFGGSRGIGKAIAESLNSIDIEIIATSKQDVDTSNLESVRKFSEKNDNVYRSSKNIHNVKVLNGLNVSSYDLINNDTLVLDKETLNNFNKI